MKNYTTIAFSALVLLASQNAFSSAAGGVPAPVAAGGGTPPQPIRSLEAKNRDTQNTINAILRASESIDDYCKFIQAGNRATPAIKAHTQILVNLALNSLEALSKRNKSDFSIEVTTTLEKNGGNLEQAIRFNPGNTLTQAQFIQNQP